MHEHEHKSKQTNSSLTTSHQYALKFYFNLMYANVTEFTVVININFDILAKWTHNIVKTRIVAHNFLLNDRGANV